MNTALTYSRGRIAVPTVEAGTLITREAGQFAAPLLSCPVRAAAGRLQFPVGTLFTAVSGAIVLYLTTDLASSAPSQPTRAPWFEVLGDSGNWMLCEYEKSTASLYFTVFSGGGNAGQVVIPFAFAADAHLVVYAGWDAGAVYAAVNAGTIHSSSKAASPLALPGFFDFGYTQQFGVRAEARFGAAAFFSQPLSSAQWQALAALRGIRPPLLGEQVNGFMTGLWYGVNPFLWTLPAGSTALDLVNTEGVTFDRLLGAGTAPVEHRGVETPLRDGKLYITSRLKERRLIARLVLEGDSVEAWYALRRDLMAALTPRSGEGVLMYAPSRSIYEIDALLHSGLGIDDAEWRRGERPAVAFDCLDPAWRNAAQASSLHAIPLSGWAVPWSLPWPFTASAQSLVLTNEGDLPSYPVFTVTAGNGGASGIAFGNDTTGKRYQTASGFLLAAGEVLTVDMDARTATKQDGSNQISQRTTTSEMWPLEVGDSAVTVSTESGSATVQVGYRRRYVGV